jgi:general secretion pathway protein G
MRIRGFTLIEMVVTVAIVGILATGAFPLAELAVKRSKEQDLRLALREIRDGLDKYKRAADAGRIELEVGDSGYPPSLAELVEGTVDTKDPEGRMMYFLRRVPRDPFYPDTSVDPADTWALRSYESGPQDPQPGEDVFDIHSNSTGVALDGTAYNTW